MLLLLLIGGDTSSFNTPLIYTTVNSFSESCSKCCESRELAIVEECLVTLVTKLKILQSEAKL